MTRPSRSLLGAPPPSAQPVAYIDANVILRFLLDDPPELASAAEDLLRRASRGELTLRIHPAVVYVLTSPRGAARSRPETARTLRRFLALEGLDPGEDLDVLLTALDRFASSSLDWVDCLLLAHAPQIPVYTFDQAMLRAGARSPEVS